MLGRLDPDNFLGGAMKLDAEGAARGIAEKIAKPLKMDTVAAAQAIVEIAISKMSLAVREVSVEKGYDPRDFALVASGGAGPLHVIAIARELHIPTVIVPLFPSHFSALGMLLADERHDFIRTFYSDLASVDFAELVKVYEEMREPGAREPAPHPRCRGADRSSICAMSGRSSRLSVPVTLAQLKAGNRKAIREAFDALYEHRYAHHSPDEPVEMVNMRLGVDRQAREACASRARQGRAGEAARHRDVYFTDAKKPVRCPVYERDALAAGARDRRSGDRAGARHHDGAVQGRRLPGRAVRRADHQGGRRVMAKASKPTRKRSAGNRQASPALDPVTLEVIRNALAGGRQRDGGRPAAHLLQHDDLRGARLLHRADRHRRAS